MSKTKVDTEYEVHANLEDPIIKEEVKREEIVETFIQPKVEDEVQPTKEETQKVYSELVTKIEPVAPTVVEPPRINPDIFTTGGNGKSKGVANGGRYFYRG